MNEPGRPGDLDGRQFREPRGRTRGWLKRRIEPPRIPMDLNGSLLQASSRDDRTQSVSIVSYNARSWAAVLDAVNASVTCAALSCP